MEDPADQPEFYEVPEGADVSALPPGTVLRERTFKYYVATMETSWDVTQLLYVTTSALGVLETNVTSVIRPPQELMATSLLTSPFMTPRTRSIILRAVLRATSALAD